MARSYGADLYSKTEKGLPYKKHAGMTAALWS
jgi:hypothetical protein